MKLSVFRKFSLIIAGGVSCLGVIFWYCFIHLLYPLPFSREEQLSDDGAYIDGQFDVFACKINNMIVTVRYIIPWRKELGTPCPSASQIVFYAPCNGEARKIRKSLPNWVKKFAAQQKATVFSLTIEVGANDMSSKELYYIYPEAGWHDIVFKVKKHIESKYGMEERKMMVTGESSGGSWCQQLIARYPEKICKGAWCGGRLYTRFKPSAKNIPMLSLNIEGCPGETVSRDLAEEFTMQSGIIRHGIVASYINKRGKREHHAANATCYALFYFFLTNDSGFDDFAKQFPDVSLSH